MKDNTPRLGFPEMRERMAEAFPVFAVPEGAERSPLARGIHEHLAFEAGLSMKRVRRFLYVWCRRPRYLESIVRSTWRVDLMGRPAGLVLPEQRQVALRMLHQSNSRGARAALARLGLKESVHA
jgi:sRNA-binding protein